MDSCRVLSPAQWPQFIISDFMGVPLEDLARAGLRVVAGALERTNATRPIPQTAAADPGTQGHRDEAVAEAQDGGEVSELPHTELQEHEALDNEPAEWETAEETVSDHGAPVSGLEREGRGQFRISVTLKVSNYGRRDPTGAFETICDLITATRRRLSERLALRQLVGPIGDRRRRGRNNNSGKAVKSEGKAPF